MIVLIATITAVLYIVLIFSTLHNLNSVSNQKVKVSYVIIGLIVILICTLFSFNISTSGINYENASMIAKIRNILIAVFVPVNGIIIMPYLANLLSKIGCNEITQEKLKKRLVILTIVFIIVLIFECFYFKSTQIEILKIIN